VLRTSDSRGWNRSCYHRSHSFEGKRDMFQSFHRRLGAFALLLGLLSLVPLVSNRATAQGPPFRPIFPGSLPPGPIRPGQAYLGAIGFIGVTGNTGQNQQGNSTQGNQGFSGNTGGFGGNTGGFGGGLGGQGGFGGGIGGQGGFGGGIGGQGGIGGGQGGGGG